MPSPNANVGQHQPFLDAVAAYEAAVAAHGKSSPEAQAAGELICPQVNAAYVAAGLPDPKY